MNNSEAMFLHNAISDRVAVTALRAPGTQRGTLTHDQMFTIATTFGVPFEWALTTFVKAWLPGVEPRYDVGEKLPPALAKTRVPMLSPSLETAPEIQCECGEQPQFDLVSLPGGWYERLTYYNGWLWGDDPRVPQFSCYAHLPIEVIWPSERTDDATEVFDAYLATLRQQNLPDNVRLTPNLRATIKQRIKAYGLDEVRNAVQYWWLSDWHLANRVTDLKILLKETNIRKFNALVAQQSLVQTSEGVNW